MADQQTLVSSSPPLPTTQSQSDDLSRSHSTSSTTSASSSLDPSLLRSLSSSRLNAGAPEFVPGRTTPPLPQPPRMIIPPPPPHGMLHMYHHQPPFNAPVLGPVPIQPHLVPVQNHHPHHHRFHHHHNRHQNQQYVPVRNHQDYLQQRGGGAVGGEQEPDLVPKKNDRRDHSKRESKTDQATETGASVTIDSKTGLPEDTIQKIVNQVEYYFSDLNLATTDHLMRFICKDPEGYVPIHVVASFKKIKAVINSNSQLAAVLQNSAKLVVSEDGKKVRRINPITESAIEELQSRIIIAENLPEDHCYQNLMKIFSTVGSVKNIRTCQPQNSGGGAPPAARSAKSDGTLFSNKVHAFVEYEMVELAEKAVADLHEAGNWRSGLRVRLMLKHQTKEPKQGQGRGRKGHDAEVEHEEDDATTSEQQPIEKQSEECSGEWDTHVQEQPIVGEDQGNEKAVGQRKGRNRGRGKGRGRGQPHQNQNNNHNGRGGNHHHQHHHHQVGTPPSNNPMNNMEQPGMGKQQPPGPRMPDGTRGFSMGRGKPVMVQAE
ncbi:PREDICTED: la-related protein 6B isoform X2 [Camelina sativa]|uniref:La-related protein 6B isoform X2 n=1 Tax=Camelina sativa TaxID=90675 RepID=A0ABM0ZMU5_CAMSA|nr:PREDICTED: la-related protein 6B isoform X2 [Camelina sativa]